MHLTLPHLQRPQAAGTSDPVDVSVKVLTSHSPIRPVKTAKHNIELFPTQPWHICTVLSLHPKCSYPAFQWDKVTYSARKHSLLGSELKLEVGWRHIPGAGGRKATSTSSCPHTGHSLVLSKGITVQVAEQSSGIQLAHSWAGQEEPSLVAAIPI